MASDISALLASVGRWAQSRPDIHGLALVGSYASGKARADSDVDLIIVADAPMTYRNGDWVQSAVGERVIRGTRWEQYGNVWSLFATLADGPEIEFAFAERSWAKADPPAAEVRRIVCDGIVILHDPDGALLALCDACGARLR